MSELSLLNLLGSGIDDITVVNRTETNAYKLATKHGVNYNTLESLPTLLTNADIVISSTSSPDFIVTKSMIESVNLKRKASSLLLIDIAVPRDIEPNVNISENIFSYDVDDLKGLVDANLRERQMVRLYSKSDS